MRTRIGPIQIGMPPESIKDSFSLGLPLPQFFLLPSERLCRVTGLNVADFGARPGGEGGGGGGACAPGWRAGRPSV